MLTLRFYAWESSPFQFHLDQEKRRLRQTLLYCPLHTRQRAAQSHCNHTSWGRLGMEPWVISRKKGQRGLTRVQNRWFMFLGLHVYIPAGGRVVQEVVLAPQLDCLRSNQSHWRRRVNKKSKQVLGVIYRIAENFQWCKFSHKWQTGLQKKFEFSHTCASKLLRPLTWRVTLQQLWCRFRLRQWSESTRISGLLLSVSNCNASVKMATDPILSLFFCAPHARIKILTSSKFRTEKILVV